MDLFSIPIAYASVDSFIAKVDRLIINPTITLLFALAVVYFLWGVAEFFLNSENEEKKTAGKSHMLWGIVGITVMIGVFTLMNVVLSTFGISGINPKTGEVELR